MNYKSVDIIIPVYRGIEDTKRCISSVLNATCTTPWRLIVINDCSPEPELKTWLCELDAHEPSITLLENPENLGFVATVNRGMALHKEHDVLLLNSDTEVAHDWLDRIQRAAYSEPQVASVTPFSNNATICSYPRFCEDNPLPDGYSTSDLDALFSRCLNGQTVQIPTAVGFCMYIRRQCLDEVGYFDVTRFGKGYGEENDFCMRATAAGWKHLQTLDTFVRHAGGISFGDSAKLRQESALQTMKQLHSEYESLVHAHILKDPAKSARLSIDMARRSWSDSTAHSCTNPYVLHIAPANGGGVDRYVRDICTERPQDCILHVVDDQVVFEFVKAGRFLPIDMAQLSSPAFKDALGLPACLHAHSTLNPVRGVVQFFCEFFKVSYVLTLHDTDFADVSDSISQTEQQARQTFVRNAASRIVPSAFIGNLAASAIGGPFSCELIENGVTPYLVDNVQNTLATHTDFFQVAVIGALGPGKGLHFLEEVAHALPPEIRIVIIGYVDGQLLPGWLIPDRIWIHGAFEPRQLPTLVKNYQSELAFFPNLRPESYCYALSDAWGSGLPALGPATGAIGERITQCGAGWTFDQSLSAILVADTITNCLRAVKQPMERIRFAVAQLSSPQEMVTALDQHYKSFGHELSLSPNLSATELLAASHLSGAFFRAELQKMAGDLAFTQSQATRLAESLQLLNSDHEARGSWIDKLQTSINELQHEVCRVENERLREHRSYIEHLEKSRCSFKNIVNALLSRVSRWRVRFVSVISHTSDHKDTQ